MRVQRIGPWAQSEIPGNVLVYGSLSEGGGEQHRYNRDRKKPNPHSWVLQ